MTFLKNNKIFQKSDVFLRKILEKDFQLFPKFITSKVFFEFEQKWLPLHSSSKLKKKENLGLLRP